MRLAKYVQSGFASSICSKAVLIRISVFSSSDCSAVMSRFTFDEKSATSKFKPCFAASTCSEIVWCTVVTTVIPHTRSEEHTSELQSRFDLVCRLLLEKQHSNLLEPDYCSY